MKQLTRFLPLLLLASCAVQQPSTQQPAQPAMMPGTLLQQGDIALDLKANKAIYQEGEPITITLKSSRRAMVKIFNEDAAGMRTQVWPNAYSGKSDIVEAGVALVIPQRGTGFALKAGAPYGINTIVAVASSITENANPQSGEARLLYEVRN